MMRAILLSLFLLASSLEAATMHALLLIDTQAEKIGSAMEGNLKLWKQKLKEIALHTDYKLSIEVLQGDKLTLSNIVNAFKKMDVKNGDGVLFYFCGHGCRSKEKKDVWPYLMLSPENMLIDFDEVLSILTAMKPRVLFAMAECCNNIVNFAPPPIAKSAKKKNYRALFQDAPIKIACSSSEPGEYSWALVGKGSCFTLEFMKALNDELLHAAKPSWEQIFQKAAKKLDRDQTPQVVIISEKERP